MECQSKVLISLPELQLAHGHVSYALLELASLGVYLLVSSFLHQRAKLIEIWYFFEHYDRKCKPNSTAAKLQTHLNLNLSF